MEFKILNQIQQLDEIDQKSLNKTQVLFKHSTRCSISAMAKRILSGEMNTVSEQEFEVYYLDLLNNRNISNEIATRYNVYHESPQLLVIKNGKCVYNASHGEVSLNKISLK